MTGSVGENATNNCQPCLKGWIIERMSALEAAYGEYRFTPGEIIASSIPYQPQKGFILLSTQDIFDRLPSPLQED